MQRRKELAANIGMEQTNGGMKAMTPLAAHPGCWASNR
jgi:hypothetical protein